jgi:hypothetical protein
VVADTRGSSAQRIFGPVDAMKLRSSMTLFAAAAGALTADADHAAGPGGAPDSTETGGIETGGTVFRAVLDEFFGGVPDAATVARLLGWATRCARWRLSALWPRRQC